MLEVEAVIVAREAACHVGSTARYGTHMFELRCREHGIEHRLTKPNHPWINGQVERMNRTIEETAVRRYYYDSHNRLRTQLADFLAAYSFAKRLKTPKSLTPYEYICKLWTEKPTGSGLIQSTTGRD